MLKIISRDVSHDTNKNKQCVVDASFFLLGNEL